MFTVKITIEDVHITELLQRIGKLPETIKVDFTPGRAGKVKRKPNGEHYVKSEDTVELLTMELHKRKLLELRGTDLKEIVGTMGLPVSSYSYYIAGLVKAGVLKADRKVGNTLHYRVTGK